MGQFSGVRVGFAALLLSGVASGALAQTAPPAPGAAPLAAGARPAAPAAAPAQNDAAPTGEIIVTALRRDESLSRTPVAVQAVSGENLEKAQVKNELDLRFATPGLQIRSGQSSNSISYSLRGQSQDPQSDTRPGVLPYFNEIPVSGQGSTTAFYDLQSIQVLKGPQGTLFGRSATGGAVLYTTQKPTDRFGGYIAGLLGNYNTRQTEGAINVPVVDDKVLLRVSGFYSTRDGFQHNYFTGKRIGDLEREGARASLTLKPNERLTNTTVLDWFHAYGQNTQSVISGLLPLAASGPPYLPATIFYSGTATPVARATGIGAIQAFAAASGFPPAAVAAVPAFYDAYFSTPNHVNTGLTGVLALQQAAGPYRPLVNGMNYYRANNYFLTNTTTYELTPDLQLKNIFGYYRSATSSTFDVDSTPYGIQDSLTGPKVNAEQKTNDLQLSGKLFDSKLNFVSGFFFSDEKTPYYYLGNFFDFALGGFPSVYHHEGRSTTYAVYAQGTYSLTDTISATAGGRYTSEKVRNIIYANDVNGALCNTTGYDCDQSRTFDNANYTFGLQDQLNPNLLLYVNTRQAYKDGGFNGFLAPKVGTGAQNGGDGFDSQRVRDVEGGAKYLGRLGDMPVRANLALYYSWINKDQRVAYVLNPAPGTEIVNVPKGETYGLEADGQISPTRWLTVGGTLNYTHARFTNGNAVVTVSNGAGGTTSSSEVYDQVPDTPEFSASGFGDITFPISGGITAVLHGDVYHQDSSFGAPRSFNNAGTIIPSYTLLNFRAGIQDEARGWSLTANLKNATNEIYYTGAFALGEIYQINTRIPGDRRTFTVELRQKF